MALSSNDIKVLLEKSPYEQSTITKLEAFVLYQLSNQTYHFESNKTLLKNYQIYSHLVNIDILCSILILSLMRLPSIDFLSLTYMIPVAYSSHPSVKHICLCYENLENGLFADFWMEYSTAPTGLYSQATGFVGAIRSFILHSLSNTFRNIQISLFLQYLGLPESEINLFVKSSPIALEIVNDKVSITSDATNLPVQIYDESLKPDEVLKIVDSMRILSNY